MSGDYIKTFKLEVEIQENGIIRDPFGWIIGRCNDDWLKLVTRHEKAERLLPFSCPMTAATTARSVSIKKNMPT